MSPYLNPVVLAVLLEAEDCKPHTLYLVGACNGLHCTIVCLIQYKSLHIFLDFVNPWNLPLKKPRLQDLYYWNCISTVNRIWALVVITLCDPIDVSMLTASCLLCRWTRVQMELPTVGGLLIQLLVIAWSAFIGWQVIPPYTQVDMEGVGVCWHPINAPPPTA